MDATTIEKFSDEITLGELCAHLLKHYPEDVKIDSVRLKGAHNFIFVALNAAGELDISD